MKIIVMNKNVEHDGQKFVKGQKLKSGEQVAEMFLKMGHAEVVEIAKDEVVVEQPQVEQQPEVASESDEQSEEPGKPSKKSKR